MYHTLSSVTRLLLNPQLLLRQAHGLPATAQHIHLVEEATGPGRWARTLRWVNVRQLVRYNATTGDLWQQTDATPCSRPLGEFTEALETVTSPG